MYWRTMAVPRGLQAAIIAVAVYLFPTVVQALSLGELKVYSALDEPLYAEILLAPAGTKEIKTLQARLVAQPDFDVAADATAPISGEVRVTVTQRQDGQHLLKLYSERPVREPYLRFLLQLDWAGGRLTREFIALIDPPELRSAGAARPDEAMTEASREETAERPNGEAQPAATPEAAASPGATSASAAASGATAKPTTRPVAASKPADAGRAAPTRNAKSGAQVANTRAARKAEPNKDVVVSETPKATPHKAEEQQERLASEIKAWAKSQEQTRPKAKSAGSEIAAPPEEQAAESETAEARVQPETSAKPDERDTPSGKTERAKPNTAPPIAADTPLLQWTRGNVTRLLIITLVFLALLAVTIAAAWYVWRRWHTRTSPRVNYGERRNGEGRRRQFLPVAIERRHGPRRDSDRVVSDYHVVHADDDYDDDVGHLETHTEEPTERVLQKAIATHPQQHSLKVKLLGLYYQSNKKQAFESLLNRLYADLVEMPDPEHQVASAFDELVQNSLAEQREDNKDISPDDGTVPSVITGIGASKTEYSYPADHLRDAITVVPDSRPIAPEDGIPVLSFGKETSQTSERENAQSERPNADDGLEWENKKELDTKDSNASPSKEKSRGKVKHSAKDSNDAGLEELSIDDLIDIGSADGHALLDDIEFEGVDTPDEPVSNKRGISSKSENEGDDQNLSAQEKSSVPKVERRRQWRDPAIKIDLAKAYIDMGDPERARHILDEVLASWHRGDSTDG